MVDLVDPQSIAEVTAAKGECVETCSENHILIDSVPEAALYFVLRVTKTSDVESEERRNVELVPLEGKNSSNNKH